MYRSCMRLKVKKISVATAFIVGSLTWADTLSLEEILNHASVNAKTLQMKQTDALIESKNIQSAESAYYPSLNLIYNAERNQALDGIPLGTESVGGITISNGSRYQSSMAVQLNYDLYHFGATDKRVHIATSEFDIKKMEWCSQEKQLHQQILERYSSARKATIEKKYRVQMLDVRKNLYGMKERLYKAGQYSKVDLGDEAIYIITIERDIENISMRYQEDLIRISQLSYMNIDHDTELTPISLNKEEIFLEKYDDTTEALILHKRITQKKDEISLQLREQLPSFGLYSNYYLYGSHATDYDYTVSHINKKSWNVGLSVRYNIFEGFKHSASKERLKLELQRLEQEFDEARHSYEYESKSKTTRIRELETLKEQEKNLLEENYKKMDMLARLREKQKIDGITQLSAQYELLERALNMEIRKIDAAFENASLQILNRGINQCSPH